MPKARLLPIKNEADNQRILESGAKDVDAIADMAEEGTAWTLLYPEFSLEILGKVNEMCTNFDGIAKTRFRH